MYKDRNLYPAPQRRRASNHLGFEFVSSEWGSLWSDTQTEERKTFFAHQELFSASFVLLVPRFALRRLSVFSVVVSLVAL